jgi:hypothetical protein
MAGEEILELVELERQTFKVTAVRITDENLGLVARWMNTHLTIDRPRHGDVLFLNVVHGYVAGRPQTVPAFVGDWITWDGKMFQKYADKKLRAIFTEARTEEKRAKVLELVKLAMYEQYVAEWIAEGRESQANETTDEIMKIMGE